MIAKVSVIIPWCNAARHVGETLESARHWREDMTLSNRAEYVSGVLPAAARILCREGAHCRYRYPKTVLPGAGLRS